MPPLSLPVSSRDAAGPTRPAAVPGWRRLLPRPSPLPLSICLSVSHSSFSPSLCPNLHACDTTCVCIYRLSLSLSLNRHDINAAAPVASGGGAKASRDGASVPALPHLSTSTSVSSLPPSPLSFRVAPGEGWWLFWSPTAPLPAHLSLSLSLSLSLKKKARGGRLGAFHLLQRGRGL